MSEAEMKQKNVDPATVYTLDLEGRKLTEIPKTCLKYKNLKSINISCNNIQSVKDDDFSICLHLKEIKLYANRLKKINGLQHLNKLEELQLQYNEITEINDSLRNNRNLKFLRLDGNKLIAIKLAEVCSLSQLTYIDISSNKLVHMNGVNVLHSLVELHVTHNKLTKLPDLHSLKKLREVDGSFNLLCDVSGLKGLPNLMVLSLEHNDIINLTSLGVLKSLQDLKLCKNRISDLQHITEQFGNLEILHISANKITSLTQVECLLKLNATLRELIFYKNPVAFEDSHEVMDIFNQMELEVLDKVYIKRQQKPLPRNVMRPMSANQMFSLHSIEDQISFTEIQMDEFENNINSRFAVLQGMLTELPASRPLSSKCSINQSNVVSSRSSSSKSNERPSSRCNSRARIEEAKAFAAAQHF